jgi:hypothetical protein
MSDYKHYPLKLINGTPIVGRDVSWHEETLCVTVVGPEIIVPRKRIPIYEFKTDHKFFSMLKDFRNIWDDRRSDIRRITETGDRSGLQVRTF